MENIILLNCVCCGFEIKTPYPEMTEIMKTHRPWEWMWNDGIVEKINAGYGSCHDGDMYLIGLCDECIKKKKEEGVIKYVGNYLFKNVDKETEAYDEWLNNRKLPYEEMTVNGEEYYLVRKSQFKK